MEYFWFCRNKDSQFFRDAIGSVWHRKNTLLVVGKILQNALLRQNLTKFSYDLWGNTVNTASRMELTSENGRIQVTPFTKSLLDEHFVLTERELIECKGLGAILTSFLDSRK